MENEILLEHGENPVRLNEKKNKQVSIEGKRRLTTKCITITSATRKDITERAT